MKRILVLILASFIVYNSYSQSNGWNYVTVNGNINQLAFNGQTGVAVGNSGIVYRSIDGGHNWTSLGNLVSNNLVDVKYAGAATFYACGWTWGTQGVLIKSIDNGVTWKVIQSFNGQFNELFGICTLDTANIYISGTNKILKSTDGGVTFSKNTFPNGYEERVLPINGSLLALAYNGTITFRLSNDKGLNWNSSTYQPSSNTYIDLTVLDSVAYAIGNNVDIIKTRDGVNFFDLTLSQKHNFLSINSFNKTLYACDNANVYSIDSIGNVGSILQTSYVFNAINASKSNLFVVGNNIIGYWSGGTLPVSILDISASNKEGNVNIEWTDANEVNISDFNIQRSLDAQNYTSIGVEPANGAGNYSFLDKNLTNSNVLYYRLEVINKDGSKQYSVTKKVFISKANEKVSIYPNPTKDKITIQGNITQIELIDNTGKVIITKQTTGNSATIDVSQLAKGLYFIQYKNIVGEIKTEKLLIK